LSTFFYHQFSGCAEWESSEGIHMSNQPFKVGRAQNGLSLLDVLSTHLQMSRKKTKQRIDQKNVLVNGRPVWMARHRLRTGDEIVLSGVATSSGAKPGAPPILYEDDHYLVVSKPPMTVTTGARSLESTLKRALHTNSLRAVHRLDRDTTGCLLFAKSADAFEKMVEEFKEDNITKLYHAIVFGRFARAETEIRKRIDNKTAVTKIRRLDSRGKATHLALNIRTGRTHQIRIHLADIDHPVLGDRTHATAYMGDKDFRTPRQMLHASGLRFTNPMSGKRVNVNDELPDDFKACLKKFNLT